MYHTCKIHPLLLLLLGMLWLCQAGAAPQFILPKYHLEPEELAVIVNDADPLSVRIGAYYQQARGIPAQNIIHVNLPTAANGISVKRFVRVKTAVDAATPDQVQAYALTWTQPYRVGCMSITSAFALGYDERFCASEKCGLTPDSPYYNYDGARPFTALGIRPTMTIAATDFERARELIDRGIAADGTHPGGTAYLVSTGDAARNVRHVMYPTIDRVLGDWITIETPEVPEGIRDRQDVLFYFTGVTQVPFLDTLRFRAGAMADHLTSVGGKMPDGKQMSVLRWLEAGATGSYGTVREPCNHLQKFPNPGIAIHRYLAGETLLEAYWKSVKQPSEGIFVGEPLARPFGGHTVSIEDDATLLTTRSLQAGDYVLDYAPSPIGPYRRLPHRLRIPFGTSELRFPLLPDGIYRLVRPTAQPNIPNTAP